MSKIIGIDLGTTNKMCIRDSMIPDLIAARSLRALAIGAKQFVVQEAAEITVSSGFNSVWLTL